MCVCVRGGGVVVVVVVVVGGGGGGRFGVSKKLFALYPIGYWSEIEKNCIKTPKKTWDMVPDDINNSKSLNEFKNKIKGWKPINCQCRLCKLLNMQASVTVTIIIYPVQSSVFVQIMTKLAFSYRR